IRRCGSHLFRVQTRTEFLFDVRIHVLGDPGRASSPFFCKPPGRGTIYVTSRVTFAFPHGNPFNNSIIHRYHPINTSRPPYRQIKLEHMKNLIPLILIIALATNFVACDDDDNTTPDGPTIGTPALTNAQVGTTVDITFNATVPGGFKSYEVSAVG